MNHTIETITGKLVSLLTPHANQICLEDVIHGLSRIARFNGHTTGEFPYSVAQHSVWCARAAMKFFDASYDTALKVLLHDAHESYTVDIVSPLKAVECVNVGPMQENLQSLILNHLDIFPPTSDERELIKKVDDLALAIEAYTLTSSKGRDWGLPIPQILHYEIWQAPMPPEAAAKQMWDTYILLINRTSLDTLCH